MTGPQRARKARAVNSPDETPGLAQVRRRAAMFIGNTGTFGLQTLTDTVLNESVEEALAGRVSAIDVAYHPDGSFEVVDDGFGLPVDPDDQGIPRLTGL